jgi:hypothetical protein
MNENGKPSKPIESSDKESDPFKYSIWEILGNVGMIIILLIGLIFLIIIITCGSGNIH